VLLTTDEDGTIKFNSKNIAQYKQILYSIPRAIVSDLFDRDFINYHKVQPNEEMAIIDGHSIEPRLFGFNSPIPDCKDYHFYLVMNNQRKKPFHRMLHC
jgi:hypothetical protein